MAQMTTQASAAARELAFSGSRKHGAVSEALRGIPESEQVPLALAIVAHSIVLLEGDVSRFSNMMVMVQNELEFAGVPLLHSVASELAWWLRQRRYEATVEDVVRSLLLPSASASASKFEAIVRCQLLRFDFNFRLLEARARIESDKHGDSLLLALHGFGLLALGDNRGSDYLERALRSADAGPRVRHAALHARWLLAQDAGEAEELLGLSSRMLGQDGPNANTYYRRAAALRLLGRFDDAIHAVGDALAIAPSDNLVVQDYIRERETIRMVQQIDFQTKGLMQAERDLLSKDLESFRTEMRQTITRGMFDTIQIIGVFVAVIAIVATNGVLVTRLASGTVPVGRAATAGLFFTLMVAVLLGLLRALFRGRRS